MAAAISLQWRHNELDGVSASRLFTQSFIRAQIKENINALRHWPLCGELTGTGEFPAQMASNAEKVSIWWRHHVVCHFVRLQWVDRETAIWLRSQQGNASSNYIWILCCRSWFDTFIYLPIHLHKSNVIKNGGIYITFLSNWGKISFHMEDIGKYVADEPYFVGSGG